MKRNAQSFDVIVIGSGSAGFSAAEAARTAGARVAVVEKGKWGGECPNWACVPTKALLRSARAYREAQDMDMFGINVGKPRYRFSDIMRRKKSIVSTITGGGDRYTNAFRSLGITILSGGAQFVDDHGISIDAVEYRAKAFVIATGSVEATPPIAGIDRVDVLTFRNIVELRTKPTSVCIIGGGPVGCEWATFFSTFDTRVHLMQLADRILDREDEEISAIVAKSLTEQGVVLHTSAKTLGLARKGRKKVVTYQVGRKKRQQLIVDQVILATGKKPNLDGLQVQAAGVRLNEKGGLIMKESMQTSVKHIFAAGDVAGGALFTHTAHAEGHAAGVNAARYARSSRTKLLMPSFSVVPHVTFVEPEVASVGMTAAEAKKVFGSILVGRFPIGALGRAVTEGDRRGLVKLIAEKKTHKILGGHIVGTRAGEMIHEVALAMYVGATLDDLSHMVHAYPTYSEALSAAAGDAL